MFYLYRRPAGVKGIIFYFVLYLTCAAKGRASINFIDKIYVISMHIAFLSVVKCVLVL